MKKFFITLIIASAMLAACGPNRQEMVNQIEDFEDSIFEGALGADPEVADKLTDMYIKFADKYKTDTLAPQYLMKAGEVQSNVLHTERAVELYDRVISQYPDFDDVPMCYFLKGNAYDLNSQYKEARAAYQEFVDLYPDHFMAKDTRTMLEREIKSPEEMLEDILANASDSVIALGN